MRIHDTHNAWAYTATLLLALVLLVVWPTAQVIPQASRRKYLVLQLITLFAALSGAKLVMMLGDRRPFRWDELAHSGRSIVGGLLFGFAAAELAKRWLRYDEPPNDAFAAKLPFSIALGRVGCLLAGCCRGVSWEGAGSVVYDDGVARFPAQLVEIGFQLAVGVVFLGIVRRGALRGRVFALYLALYGVFRFGTEFLRDTPKVAGGVSIYQGLAVVMVLLGGALVVFRKFPRTEAV